MGWYDEAVRLKGETEVVVDCSSETCSKVDRDLLVILHAQKGLHCNTESSKLSVSCKLELTGAPFALASRHFTSPIMPASERSPLLPTSKQGARNGSSAASQRSRAGVTPSAQHPSSSAAASSAAAHFFSEDDIAIEGMVLVLLQELEDRGYAVPAGLVDPPVDMPVEEAEAETAVFRTVFSVPRHRLVLNEYLPYLERATVEQNGQASSGGPGSARSSGGAATGSSTATPYSSNRPSPLSSQVLDTDVLTSPSALLLAALLSLLISLQAEVTSQVQETDRGVDGELRMFKARRELGERLYAVVGGLLDSYLLSGDSREVEGEDALVTLLFHDFALNYDSMDRATCCECSGEASEDLG